MKVEIKNKTEEPLLSRQKIEATVAFEGPVPKRQDILQDIAAQTKAKPELVLVFKIDTHYGSQKANVLAYAYTDADAMSKIEETKKFKRTGYKAPVVEAKEEAPAEEAKTEEPAKEEAKE